MLKKGSEVGMGENAEVETDEAGEDAAYVPSVRNGSESHAEDEVEDEDEAPGDVAREETEEAGCILTRILPSSEGVVSKDMSRLPRAPTCSASISDKNCSLRVDGKFEYLRACISVSRSMMEEELGRDQS
jgi:hypothetical protein